MGRVEKYMSLVSALYILSTVVIACVRVSSLVRVMLFTLNRHVPTDPRMYSYPGPAGSVYLAAEKGQLDKFLFQHLRRGSADLGKQYPPTSDQLL